MKPAVEPASFQPHMQKLSTIRAFELHGRIGVQTEKKGFSGTLRWQHQAGGDDLGLFSPLGNQVGQIHADLDGVTLVTSDQKTYRAADAETLTEKTLGWRLPMSGLHDWVLGRPTVGAAQILSWDDAGNITHLRQDGWDIEYPQYAEFDGQQLPVKIVIKSIKLDLKLVIEGWQTESGQIGLNREGRFQ